MEGKSTVGFALLAAMAMCCTVMYMTADGAESVMEADAPHAIGSGQDSAHPQSIESVDVKKTGLIYTKTPDTLKKGKEGRERLLDFFNKVEDNIAKEVEGRKADIAAIRTEMQKNMEYNADARKKMKAALLSQMAQNAKLAKDNLRRAMRETQKNFADAAKKENAIHRADIKRFRATRKLMRLNKREARKNLRAATQAQQRALSALASATNAKIKSSNKHIAANSAQIKENSKKARQDLDNAMDAFNNKMANVMEEAKKGRSKLATQAALQDKKFREYAQNEVNRITAETAQQFDKVRKDMATERARCDAQITHAAARMDAALNAQSVLEDKHFAQTVSDIAAAKAEATERVNKFQTGFKADILHLSEVAEEQNKKLNKRVADLGSVVENNKLAQAKVDHEVDAELKRMLKLGNKRYQEHLAKDSELKTLMTKNKDDNKKQITEMATEFYGAMAKIKEQMKADRAHAENRLATETAGLYQTLDNNQKAQDAAAKAITDSTVAMKNHAAVELRKARDDFSKRLGSLHTTVVNNLKKNDGKIKSLVGVVEADAVKSAQGRATLRKISDANAATLKSAVEDAVHKGEQRALQIEKKMKDTNDKTAKQMDTRITAEIGDLTKHIHSQISELTLETAEARALMKKEVLFAVTAASKLAKQNLKKVISWSEGEFSKLDAGLLAENTKSAGERATLRATVAADRKHALDAIDNAVATQNAALLAFKMETNSKIKKTNTALDAQANIMEANAKAVGAQMAANQATITASLESARKSAQSELSAVSTASAARYNAVVKAVEDGVASATKKADEKFTKLYLDMAAEKKRLAQNLKETTSNFNAKLATQSALEDDRFSKTVKNLAAAKAEAAKAVKDARTEMLVGIVEVTAKAKESGTRVQGKLQIVSDMALSDKAAQLKINKEVKAEMARIEALANEHASLNRNARGVIKEVMDKNKQAAHDEVKALSKKSHADLKKARAEQAAHLLGFKKDLTHSTEKLYEKMAADAVQQNTAIAALHSDLGNAKTAAAASLENAKKIFGSKTTTLTNAITANMESYKRKMVKVTGIASDWQKAAGEDRKNIRAVRKSMVDDLNKNIVRAIELGEARMKGVEAVAMANIATEKKALLTTISESVENMADNVFAAVQGDRQKIADNYLSLKAYSATAADKISDYLAKGKGRNLSSIGDLLQSISRISNVKVPASTGEGFGGDKIALVFSGKEIKIDNSISKINGLVNEYVATVGQVKERWPLGLGKYLISKLEVAMQGTGALEVDKVTDKAGNFVFINAHAVGLSSKLGDFQSLAVRMNAYERNLAGQTASLPTTKTASHITIGPPQWQGN